MSMDSPKQDPMEEARWKLNDIVRSYIEIAFTESNSKLLDGAITALNRAKKFIDAKGKSKLDKIFGGRATTF